ncbi:hypothetical protein DSECCO2_349880 [anaerobic digester metagenome]
MSSMNRLARSIPYCLMIRFRIAPSNAPIDFLSTVPVWSWPSMILTNASRSQSVYRHSSQLMQDEARKTMFRPSGRIIEKTCLLDHFGVPSSSVRPGSGRCSNSKNLRR